MARDTIQNLKNVPSDINTYFLEKGYDYVEYLGDFMKYKVYRAGYYDENVLAHCQLSLQKGTIFESVGQGMKNILYMNILKKPIIISLCGIC